MKLFFESVNSNYLNSIMDRMRQLVNSGSYIELLDETRRLQSAVQKLTMNSYKIWNIDIEFKNNELTKNLDEKEFLQNLFRNSDIKFNDYSWANGLSVMSDIFDDEAELKISSILDAVSSVLTYNM